MNYAYCCKTVHVREYRIFIFPYVRRDQPILPSRYHAMEDPCMKIIMFWINVCEREYSNFPTIAAFGIDQLQLVLSGGDSGPRGPALSWHPGPTSWAKMHGASFLVQTTIQTRQILFGFYPSVQITSQFMSHDWELLVCMESQLRSEYFSRSHWQFGQNNVGENDEVIFSMPYLASWRHRRCSKIKAVPRQSFVIHPNGGWWQSTFGNPKAYYHVITATRSRLV
jgi:hypothetical protein